MKDIFCVVFDLGNVLFFFDHFIIARKLSKFSRFSAKECFDIVISSDIDKDYEKGLLSTQQFYKSIMEMLEISDPSLDQKTFSDIWSDIFSPNHEMLEFLKDLKCQKMLLSNTCELHYDFIEKKYNISKYFSYIATSHKVKARKPEKEIFKDILSNTDIKPENILYIDDIANYTEAFSKFGVNGLTYSKETFDEEIKKFNFLEVITN